MTIWNDIFLVLKTQASKIVKNEDISGKELSLKISYANF